ncbi:MAG: NUDIX domain-containing protein, partial [Nitrosopumilaceae archaeon]
MRKKKIFEGKVLSLSLYDVIIEKRKVRREIIEHRGAAAILAMEMGKVILVKQHRFPHGYVLEIPAGTMNKGEKDPKKCAFRELK